MRHTTFLPPPLHPMVRGMDDRRPNKPDGSAAGLRAALRTARVEEAERSGALADLRALEVARLEMLLEAITPTLAQVPADVEMFDCGLVPGPHPRLFIDMLAFVEMTHDRRAYRFVQATRHGRTVLAETDAVDAAAAAVTGYVARRLVEREKALATAPPPPAPAMPRRRWFSTLGAIVLEYLGLAALAFLAFMLLSHGREIWSWFR